MLILFGPASNGSETSGIQTEYRKHFFFLTSKLQVTLQFLSQAAYTQYKQYSQVMYACFVQFENLI